MLTLPRVGYLPSMRPSLVLVLAVALSAGGALASTPFQPKTRAPATPAVPQVASKPNGDSVVATKRDSDEDAGRRLWNRSCWQCHGELGKGDGPAAASLVGGVPSLEGKVKTADFDALVGVIQAGRGRMPAYAEDIDKHDSRRILVYLEARMAGRVGATPEVKGDAEDKKAAEEN